MHRFFAPDIDPSSTRIDGPRDGPANSTGDVVVELPSDEAHHLIHVLRLRRGDAVIVFDGRGHEWEATVAQLTRAAAHVTLTRTRPPVPEPRVHLTLAIALLKGDSMDVVIRDATALGVAEIVPVVSAHVVVPVRAWKTRSADRWTRVAVAAAKQCARAVVPVIGAVTPFAELLSSRLRHGGSASSADLCVLCAEPSSGVAGSVNDLPRPSRALVCIGPEGGWAAAEVASARDHHARIISLGPRTIRAELMPAVALSALWTHWGWG
jgi:16S rRNA (uracil1498-N3)-methyltransferase